MANKITGKGIQLKRGDGGTPVEAFTEVASVLRIDRDGPKQEIVDVTTIDSANDYREKIAGLKDSGSISLEIVVDPADTAHRAIEDTDLDGGVKRNWQLVFPAPVSKTYAFSAFVAEMSEGFPMEDKITRTMKLEITGKGTWS